ncbi:MAG: pyruvate:ferredoxin (flavodoxin) oxidoreductase [Lachnospiraceae bacterium]|nr:pyruvate:ferredoxin (flavodoxin) oxidoreductase [Lachnospiraceae bacterium]
MKRIKMTMDGNEAAAYVSYAYTEVATIYPITPSSVMPEHVDEWATAGRKNIFGSPVQITEMQSEAGAAGALHGALTAGAFSSTYTASQGLLLMIPNLYKCAGERLPGVFNVAARAVGPNAISIFGDHSDVYACRQTGAAMLCGGSVQEVMDLTPVAYCAAMQGRMTFINFFDGFRTSHEIQKIDAWDYEDLKDMLDMDALKAFKDEALNPNNPYFIGACLNSDTFMQQREAINGVYDALPDVVTACMNKVNEKIGTDYRLFNYHGAPDAEHVVVAMGSVNETIEETVDALVARGEKVGMIKVRLFRPFSKEAFLKEIPASVKQITILDRTKEPGAAGEPLALDVIACLRGSEFHNVKACTGRYGIAGKDTPPAHIAAVFHNTEKEVFTIGIVDDVTGLSLTPEDIGDTTPEGTHSCKFWGLGADGTVGANKNSIKIIGDHTNMYAQAYFDYDSKKSGGVTMSHLRFGNHPIKSTYLIKRADFVACHNPSYVRKFNMVQEVKDGGTFLLNCAWNAEELESHLPGQMKKYIAEHNIRFATIDGVKLGIEAGLGPTRINTILQSAFFSLTGIIPKEEAIALMKEAARETYERKGEEVVSKNFKAIDLGATGYTVIDVPASWKDAKEEGLLLGHADSGRQDTVDFVNNVQAYVNVQEGYNLKVSDFLPYASGHTPSGTSAYEKRGIAVNIPVWASDNCIQCGFCSYVCPHAAIRIFALTEEEKQSAPAGTVTLPMTGMDGKDFAVAISSLDCTGCGSCVETCPGKKGEKALIMERLEEAMAKENEQAAFDYMATLPVKEDVVEKFKETSIKGSQFKKPYLEFSGACAGCGETPYAKLVTQLFGDHMYIANATGCSSIWANSSPSTPYCVDEKGRGPAWANSLFEDAAEYGLGMLLAQDAIRANLCGKVQKLAGESAGCKAACDAWVETYEDTKRNASATEALIEALEKDGSDLAKEILAQKMYLAKKSQWIFGGDGWAYDIGFGGLDHVLASNRNINMLVLNTEVYSNTGGQSSKATPMGATAQFAAGGKETLKKDLAAIAMSYGYVYVAQVSMGADKMQCLKAIAEAEAYPGPSIVIAYAPCINHGLKKGMAYVQEEEKQAVDSGYWNIFRYNPAGGDKKFVVDSKEPSVDYEDFLSREVRYTALSQKNPERAKRLFAEAARSAREKYEHLKKLETLYNG